VLSKKLEDAMMANTCLWRKSGLLIESVDSRPTKPIIDEIDQVLSQHYGFIDEEFDFIVNYDFKFRVGKKIPRPMTSEIATGGGPPLSILGELRDFSFVEVRDARWLQERIVEISPQFLSEDGQQEYGA
jgi:hypothetical protein